MAIVIAVIENHKNKEIDSLCADYLKKLTGTYATKLEILPAARVTDPNQQKVKELIEEVSDLVKKEGV